MESTVQQARAQQRWERAEAALQRAWDAYNARPTASNEARQQRAFDKAQAARYAYGRLVNPSAEGRLGDGYHDGWGPDDA